MFDDSFKEILFKLAVSLVIGLLLGTEREYRNKSAGIRTIMLICIGSTIFTILSMEMSHETEVGRIASNIITGIGFLGAGAIMREGLSISGLTTASTIWVTAALGMAVGYGEYQLAITATIIAMAVLILFTYFQRMLDAIHKTLTIRIVFPLEENGIEKAEHKMEQLNITYERKKECRKEGEVNYTYELAGRKKNVDKLIQYLILQNEKVKSFEY
jgi:putative Mg2+ transporter-C (MgtC) family protein